MRWMCLAILLSSTVRAAQPAPDMEKYYLVLMVQARRLEVEVLAWWMEKGAISFRPPPAASSK